MIQDLHSHTYYSFCGKDKPEEIVEAAIEGGIELFGITDHAHGVGQGRRAVYRFCQNDLVFPDYERTLVRYFDHINLIKEKYKDKITILRGIEVNTQRTLPHASLPDGVDLSFFDYCLVEHLDYEDTITNGDLFAFARRCGCPKVGVAHTDLFAFINKIGADPLDYFKRMAEENIFWEMNVSYDSIHKYHEHEYVAAFFESEAQQRIIRESGVRLSVGFDGHRVNEYRADRVTDACRRIKDLGLKLVFEA